MASAGLDACADVEPPERGQHVVAEPARADHRGDDHHVEREHDDLVDADHQLRPRRGKHHLASSICRRVQPAMRAELDDLVRHGLEAPSMVTRTIGGMA